MDGDMPPEVLPDRIAHSTSATNGPRLNRSRLVGY